MHEEAVEMAAETVEEETVPFETAKNVSSAKKKKRKAKKGKHSRFLLWRWFLKKIVCHYEFNFSLERA